MKSIFLIVSEDLNSTEGGEHPLEAYSTWEEAVTRSNELNANESPYFVYGVREMGLDCTEEQWITFKYPND